ncbi:DeoR/GlpR family DNA-binding transcription regulator [Aeromicrobium sp. PE09-221]|uniref:DeoR/GlpR family DNA-binding transcription regulator n=1 Tax=Aeromicrobium sp. PE09-221 TaxID=1898043 RepID=UPI000B3E7A20|nr:DeoR/GlpR family DNA-binding transcription regulator [Aeromicrobium sp. PE09-221]
MTQLAIPAERWGIIEQQLAAREFVRTVDLVDVLGVSIETVRRDLAALESRGTLVRVRGGAVAAGHHPRAEGSYGERSASGRDEKARIGRAAAELIADDATIIIDVGTTALQVVAAMAPSFQGLLLTGSLPAATLACERLSCEVVVLGGRVRPGDLAVSGGRADQFLGDFRPDIAFLGSGGVDAVDGLTDFHYEEARLRQRMLALSARSWVLADGSKHRVVAPVHVANLDQLAGLVTDVEPGGDLGAALDAAGVEVRVAR